MTSRLRLRKVATPPAARPGQETVFVDSDDSHLKSIDSAGSVTDLESGGGGGASWHGPYAFAYNDAGLENPGDPDYGGPAYGPVIPSGTAVRGLLVISQGFDGDSPSLAIAAGAPADSGGAGGLLGPTTASGSSTAGPARLAKPMDAPFEFVTTGPCQLYIALYNSSPATGGAGQLWLLY